MASPALVRRLARTWLIRRLLEAPIAYCCTMTILAANTAAWVAWSAELPLAAAVVRTVSRYVWSSSSLVT